MNSPLIWDWISVLHLRKGASRCSFSSFLVVHFFLLSLSNGLGRHESRVKLSFTQPWLCPREWNVHSTLLLESAVPAVHVCHATPLLSFAHETSFYLIFRQLLQKMCDLGVPNCLNTTPTVQGFLHLILMGNSICGNEKSAGMASPFTMSLRNRRSEPALWAQTLFPFA